MNGVDFTNSTLIHFDMYGQWIEDTKINKTKIFYAEFCDVDIRRSQFSSQQRRNIDFD